MWLPTDAKTERENDRSRAYECVSCEVLGVSPESEGAKATCWMCGGAVKMGEIHRWPHPFNGPGGVHTHIFAASRGEGADEPDDARFWDGLRAS